MKYTITLDSVQIDLIRSALADVERTGWYYGRKDQFDKRLQTLIKKIDSIEIETPIEATK